MRRFIPLLLVITLAGAACGDEVAADATGAEVYRSVCARCHGSDLSGGVGPAIGAGSPSVGRPVDYFTQTVERGFGRMPSFGGTLTAAQIDRVVEFMIEKQEG